MRVTDAWLKNAKNSKIRPKGRYDVTQTGRPGFMVRVHPGGAVTFRMRYNRDGKRFVMVLGDYPHLSLSAAHEIYDDAQRLLRRGLDPIEERERHQAQEEKARQERTDAGTVADLVEQFIHRKLRGERWNAEARQWERDPKAKTRPRKRPEAAEALLKANLVDKIGRQKAQDVTKRQLVQLLDQIVDRGAPITANRVYALLKQCFDYGVARDLIPASPMAGIERPGGEERPRERVLTEDEIRAFWQGLDTAEMSQPTRLALRLLLVTAQRRAEITFAQWAHFDLNSALWTIPPELSKNGRQHTVPLSPLALELLSQLKVLTGEKTWLLPSQYTRKKPDAPYSERVLSRAVRDNEAHFGIPHFTPHDLRRTAASFMTKLGVPRLHVEKVLNHTVLDIAEIYDRHDYAAEKKAALERWGAYLQEIVQGCGHKTMLPSPTT